MQDPVSEEDFFKHDNVQLQIDILQQKFRAISDRLSDLTEKERLESLVQAARDTTQHMCQLLVYSEDPRPTNLL